MRNHTSVFVGIVAATALGLAGCSGSMSIGGSSLDSEKLQNEIAADINEVVGTEAATVSCPEDIALQQGATFTCTATVGSQTLTVNVTQTDDQGNVEYEQADAVIDLDTLETELAPQLVQQLGGTWKVACDPAGSERFYVAAPAEEFECTASGEAGDGRTADALPLVVTVENVEGEVTWTTQ